MTRGIEIGPKIIPINKSTPLFSHKIIITRNASVKSITIAIIVQSNVISIMYKKTFNLFLDINSNFINEATNTVIITPIKNRSHQEYSHDVIPDACAKCGRMRSARMNGKFLVRKFIGL